MFVSLAALALSGAAWVPRIAICVSVAPSVPAAAVAPALDEAEAIWGTAGIVIEWREDRCSRGRSGARLSVSIDDQMQRQPAPGRSVLGWIEFADGKPLPRIVISQAALQRTLDQEDHYREEPAAARYIRLGRAIGRALAHEIGHYLLRSTTHPAAGLMRATHTARDFFSLNRVGFNLTADEVSIARLEAMRLGQAPVDR